MTTGPGMSERINVTVSPSHLQLALGERADVVVTARNRGSFVDQFELQVEGLDPGWFTLHVSQVSLFPGDEGRLEMEVDLPADRSIAAGLRRLRLRVFSWHDPQHMAVLELPLEVLPVGGLELTLSPRLVTTRRSGQFRVMMANVGNAEQLIDLAVTDPEEALDARLELDRVAIAPGATEEVAFTIGPRRLQLVVPPHRYPFTVAAMPAGLEVGEPLATAEGTLVYHAPLAFLARLIPRLASVARISLVLAAAGAIAVWLLGSPGLRGPSAEVAPTRAPIVLPPMEPFESEEEAEEELEEEVLLGPDGRPLVPGAPGVPGVGPDGEPLPVAPPRIAVFDLSVAGDAQQRELELSWEVEDADEVLIDGEPQPAVGAIRLPGPPEGEIQLVARNSLGEVSRSIGILVVRAPDILLLEAAPQVVQPGQPAVLSWEVRRAERATLFGPGLPAEGEILDPSAGTLEIAPESTAIYRFVVDNAAGRVERRIAVGVEDASAVTEPGAAPSPEALTAGAEPLSIQRFGLIAGIDDPEHPIPLEWQVTGATEIRVERSDPPTGRERPYQAIESTEYMLAASNQSQTLLQSFTVYVLRPPLIESFEAHRTEVRAGEWVQLSWVVSGADRVYVDGELMDAPWSGATYVQPETTHEYVLRAENGIGETIRQVLVVVSPARTVLPVSRLPINSFVTHD